MDNLYCFRVDEITGEITKYMIKEDQYKFRPHHLQLTGRGIYSFDGKLIGSSERHYSISEMKLDRFTNNKVFTRNPSSDDAKKLILDTLTKKIKESERLVRFCKHKKYLIEKFKEEK